jgi:CheY-like chemotaxis protein
MPSVLVVEDDITLRTTLVYQLERFGVKADSAANGIEALRRVHNYQYLLILMDCQMPEMDGIEATSAIRAYEKSKGLPAVPIIALSGSDEEERALSAGMNAYFYKPVDKAVLQQILDTWLPPEKRKSHTIDEASL